MFDQLFSMFTGSPQGQQAVSQLMGQGYTQQQAHGILGAALPVATHAMHAHLSGQGPGLLNIGDSNWCMNFLSGAVTGLIRGDGFSGAAIDGLEGVVGGHVAQVIAGRFGLPQRTAGMIGAVITPLMISFLWAQVQGARQGQSPFAGLFGGNAAAQTPYGVPVGPFGQPMFGAPQPAYGQPQYGYGQPQYGQPQYGQPPFQAPPGFYGQYNR
jgi:hypothetical protein